MKLELLWVSSCCQHMLNTSLMISDMGCHNDTTNHRECRRHLVTNFKKRFHGKVYDENLWPAALASRGTSSTTETILWYKDHLDYHIY
jgi:hypothetical protein